MADIYGEGNNSKKQWDKLKDAPLKDKLKYIAQYYGIAIIAIIAGIIFIVSMTRTIIYNSVPVIISVEAYSSVVSDEAGDRLMEKIAPKLDADPSKYHIEVTSSLIETSDIQQAYAQSQKVFARMAARDLDVVIGRESFLISYMSKEDPENRAFYNLHDILSDELYERLLSEDKIVFLEGAEVEYPYGIDLTNTDLAETIGLFGEGNVMTFVISSDRLDAQKAAAELIYED